LPWILWENVPGVQWRRAPHCQDQCSAGGWEPSQALGLHIPFPGLPDPGTDAHLSSATPFQSPYHTPPRNGNSTSIRKGHESTHNTELHQFWLWASPLPQASVIPMCLLGWAPPQADLFSFPCMGLIIHSHGFNYQAPPRPPVSALMVIASGALPSLGWRGRASFRPCRPISTTLNSSPPQPASNIPQGPLLAMPLATSLAQGSSSWPPCMLTPLLQALPIDSPFISPMARSGPCRSGLSRPAVLCLVNSS
jgi:hypothetical protein